MSKPYDAPLDLLALAAAELLEPEELERVEQALAAQPDLAAAVEDAWEALNERDDPPALPTDGWARLSEALDARDAAPTPEAPPEAPRIVIALACVYCHDGLERRSARYCASCLAPHHGECFAAHGHCAAPGCSEVQTVRAEVTPVARPRPPRWRGLGLVGAGLLVLGGAIAAFSGNDGEPPTGAPPPALDPRVEREPTPPAPAQSGAAEPEDTDARYARELDLGHAQLAEGRPERALEHYREAVEIQPTRWEAHRACARVSRTLGRDEEALMQFETALERGLGRFRSEEEAQLRFEIAVLLRDRLDYEAADVALATVQTLLEERPSDWGELEDEVDAFAFELLLSRADRIEAEVSADAKACLESARALRLSRAVRSEDDWEVDPTRWRHALNFAIRSEDWRLARLVGVGLSDDADFDDVDRARAYAARGLLGYVDQAWVARSKELAQADFEVALALDPDSALAKDGMRLRDGQRPRGALAGAAQAGRGDAGRAHRFLKEAQRLRSLALRARKEDYAVRARRACLRALQVHPLLAEAHLLRAQLFAEWGHPELALECVRLAHRVDPGSSRAFTEEGLLQLEGLPPERRDPAAARRAFDRAVAAAQPGEEGPALYGLARTALEELRLLDEDAPGGATLRGGLLAEARSNLAQAVRVTRDRYPEARADEVERALRYQRALQALCAEHGPPADASAWATRVAGTEAAARESGARLFARARELRERQQYREAVELFDVALTLDPTNATGFNERGSTYLKIGNFVPGILDLARSLELDPRRADQVYTKVYQVSFVVDLNRAITELNEVVADHPEEAHAVFLRGFFYVAKSEYKRAELADLERGIADFDRCLELNPRFVVARIYRGFLALQRARLGGGEGDPATLHAALSDFEAAEALDPESPIVPYMRGIYWSLRAAEPGLTPDAFVERRERAIRELELAVERGYDAPERLRSEPAFEPLRDAPAFQRLLGGGE